MRLFVATPLPEEIEQYLGEIIDRLADHSGGIKWVAAKNIHLTLRFLGETEPARVGKVTNLIDDVASQYAAVDTVLDNLGGFPNLKKPRIIWAGLDNGIEELSQIALQLELGVRKLRFEPEQRRFKAHLTLGRIRDHRQLGDMAEQLVRLRVEPHPFRFDRIVLFKSTLTPGGAIYERLHEACLGEERFGD